MTVPTQSRLAWYLEAYSPKEHRWLTISHLSQYHRGYFQIRSRHLPVLITNGPLKPWRELLPTITNLGYKQLSLPLRTPYQQQGHLQTGHPRGLGLHVVTVTDLATAVIKHPDQTELVQLWTALHYSYGDELGLTSSDPVQPIHLQAQWSNIRLVVWSYTNQRLTTERRK